MADKRISQLVDRGTVANNDVVPIVVSGAVTTNKATISSIQTFMQGNLDLGVTSVGITLGSSGTDVSVTGSPITTSGNITINIPTASASNRGLLSSADWITFNAKQPAGNYVTTDTVQTITANKSIITGGGGNTLTVSQTSGSGIALNITKFGNGEGLKIEKFSGSGNAVTITGGLLSAEAATLTGALNGTSANFSNDVKIGSNSGTSLQINGNVSDNIGNINFFNNAGTTIQSHIFSTPSDLSFATYGNRPINFATNNGAIGGGTRLTIAGTGEVTLTGALNGTSAVFSGNVTSGSITANSGNRTLTFDNITNFGQQLVINAAGSLPLILRNNGNNTLFLDSTGAATFSSSVTATQGKFYSGSGSIDSLIVNGAGGIGSTRQGTIKFGDAGNIYRIEGGQDYEAMNFLTNNTPRLVIKDNGNVGIGTAAPAAKLLVNLTTNENVALGSLSAIPTGRTLILQTTSNGGQIETYSSITSSFVNTLINPSGGNVLVNTTDLPSATTRGFGIGVDSFGTYIQNRINTTSNYGQVGFFNPNGQVGSITTNGSVTSYNMTSDYRLKEDLQEIKGLEKVQAIKVYDYKWKSDESRMDGVLAHELAEVLPYAVTGEKDEMNEDGSDKMQGVDYSKIVPILIKAIQELKTEIDSLKNQMK